MKNDVSDSLVKLCGCGCGRPTLGKFVGSRRRRSQTEFLDFIHGHHPKPKGEASPNWIGGRWQSGPYQLIYTGPKGAHAREHVLIVETILGKPLPSAAQVHHVNGKKKDNRNCNLVVCEDAAYHGLLHRRTKALLACGNPTWRRCWICDTWDAPENLYVSPSKKTTYHTSCYTARQRRLRYGLGEQ